MLLATNGANTVHLTGINASSLNDGTITIVAKATSSYGDNSANSGSLTRTKDTVAPSTSVSLNTPTRAFLSGGNLYYKGNQTGNFKLSDAVTDNGSGPASAIRTIPPRSPGSSRSPDIPVCSEKHFPMKPIPSRPRTGAGRSALMNGPCLPPRDSTSFCTASGMPSLRPSRKACERSSIAAARTATTGSALAGQPPAVAAYRRPFDVKAARRKFTERFDDARMLDRAGEQMPR